MKSLNKDIIIKILLIIICVVFFKGINAHIKFNTYVEEDMKYIVEDMYRNTNRVIEVINSEILSKENPNLNNNQITYLINNIRDIAGVFYKLSYKSRIVDEKFNEEFSMIKDEYFYNKDFNEGDIRNYLYDLEDKSKSENHIVLTSDDIKTFENIYFFYSKRSRELEDFIKKVLTK